MGKWNAACGRPLSDDNLYCLASKAFRDNKISRSTKDYNKRMLSWSQFCKENLPDRDFTFWEWFYRTLILTSTHINGLWSDGHITGFITKQDAERKLKKQPNGCFLLRYSDSELGGVNIVYVEQIENKSRSISWLRPYTPKDLAMKSLADFVLDLPQLKFLYPSISKEVFRNHIKTREQRKSGDKRYKG